MTVTIPPDAPRAALTLTAPAGWTLQADTPAGVQLLAHDTTYQLILPRGVAKIVCIKKQ